MFGKTLFPVACVAVWLSAAAGVAQVGEQPAAGTAESKPVAVAKPSGPRVVAAPADVAPAPETKAPAAQAASGSQLPPERRVDASPVASADAGNLYVIGALDVLYVRVWGNQNLTGLVDVRPDGMLSMPLIGEMKADGVTVGQLREMIRTRLEDFLNKPEVDIQVTKVNSKKFYIFGEVGRQGEFPLSSNLTVLDALSSAGGFRDFANPKKIYILRGTQKLPFNYKDVSNGKHMEQNIRLQNGDRIFVP